VKRQFLFGAVLSAVITLPLAAQDFGFGFDDETDQTVNSGSTPRVSISGEVSASLLAYVNDFSEGLEHTSLGDMVSGKLNFSAGSSIADACINLKLTPSSSPVTLDEAYARAYFGSFDIEAGLRKLTWGKADSFGPLDVVNPLDYSELTDVSSMMNLKIALPLVHASLRFGTLSKLEAVFVPFFESHKFAPSGSRWAPAQMGMLLGFATPPDTSSLAYAQTGLRYTTTLGPADIGAQYYFGRLQKPAARININPSSPVPSVEILYNPYHQIGVDFAQVIAGFNVRAEVAANITEDLAGDDGGIYNPSLAWSFGFDRDLFWGINLNLQVNENIRLLDGKIGSTDFSRPDFDIEGGSNMTLTQVTAILSKKFLRDELELRFIAMSDIEDKDFYLMPSLVWTKNDVSVELAGGIFGGDEGGQFGQYRDNGFVKAVLTYSF
jgi:hypothetical protein